VCVRTPGAGCCEVNQGGADPVTGNEVMTLAIHQTSDVRTFGIKFDTGQLVV
jgi:hypothetical protein